MALRRAAYARSEMLAELATVGEIAERSRCLARLVESERIALGPREL